MDGMDGWGAHLYINLVPAQHNRNGLAHALEVAMPVGDVLIGDSRRHIEHDDPTLSLDIIPIAQTTKLFLAGRVPDVETDRAKVGCELERVDLDAEGGNVFLFEFTGQVALRRKKKTEIREDAITSK
jgi:hypothetical protein